MMLSLRPNMQLYAHFYKIKPTTYLTDIYHTQRTGEKTQVTYVKYVT